MFWCYMSYSGSFSSVFYNSAVGPSCLSMRHQLWVAIGPTLTSRNNQDLMHIYAYLARHRSAYTDIHCIRLGSGFLFRYWHRLHRERNDNLLLIGAQNAGRRSAVALAGAWFRSPRRRGRERQKGVAKQSNIRKGSRLGRMREAWPAERPFREFQVATGRVVSCKGRNRQGFYWSCMDWVSFNFFSRHKDHLIQVKHAHENLFI
jgi:hypothetical protein